MRKYLTGLFLLVSLLSKAGTIYDFYNLGVAHHLYVRDSFSLTAYPHPAGYVLTCDSMGNATWQIGIGSAWSLTGNAGTDPTTNFLGTTDNEPVNVISNWSNYKGTESEYSSLYLSPGTSSVWELTGNDSINNCVMLIDASNNNGPGNTYLQISSGYYDGSNKSTILQYPDSIQISSQNSSGFIDLLSDVSIDGSLQLQLPTGYGTGKILTSDAAGNCSWNPSTFTQLDSVSIYTSTPTAGTVYDCTNCTGNGIASAIVTYIASAWYRVIPNGASGGGTLPYKVYSATITTSFGSVSVVQLQNTIGDGSGNGTTDLAWTNPSNGVLRATMTTGSPFTANKLFIMTPSANGGGVPYFVTGFSPAVQLLTFNIIKYDGTQTVTPNTSFNVEIRVYQ